MNPGWKKENSEKWKQRKKLLFHKIFYDGNKYIFIYCLQSGIFRINRTGVGNLSETVALPYLLGIVLQFIK